LNWLVNEKFDFKEITLKKEKSFIKYLLNDLESHKFFHDKIEELKSIDDSVYLESEMHILTYFSIETIGFL
jgi:hypothetical protein